MSNQTTKIEETCKALAEFLKVKNLRYGNSALAPLKIFHQGSAENALDVRIDDKLSRIKNSSGLKLRKNDVVDLIGYLILKCISEGWTSFDDLVD